MLKQFVTEIIELLRSEFREGEEAFYGFIPRKITASFAQFALLKDSFDWKIDFSTITGSMTDEEDEIWYAYLKS